MVKYARSALTLLVLLAASPSSADPPPSTADQIIVRANAELEKDRLKSDPADRPTILGITELVPSEAGSLSSVSVDCGQAPPRIESGRPHVRCRITITTIVQIDAAPIEEELSELSTTGTMGAKAFDEACNYLAGKPMRSEKDPASYSTRSKIWSNVLALRLDEARRQATESQRAFLAGVVQACQVKSRDWFLGTYVSYLRDVEERTCHVESLGYGADFEKVDADTWVARPAPYACGETSVLTLFRAPGGGIMWNYRSVDTYPAPPRDQFCAPAAGKTYVHEFLLTNRRLREPGCRYFQL